MQMLKNNLTLIFTLLMISSIVYFMHYLLYHRLDDIFSSSLINLAVTPIEILVLTYIINRLLNQHEKQNKLEKLNMVIGTFYSEVGTDLLKLFSSIDQNLSRLQAALIVTQDWSDKDFKKVRAMARTHPYQLRMGDIVLPELSAYLLRKRDFMLRMLENPNLLEHETFTDLLKSVFHLTEELSHRRDLRQVHSLDLNHLTIDLKRAYTFLLAEWIEYMKYLKKNYPYLFSFAMRTNPFDLSAHIEITHAP